MASKQLGKVEVLGNSALKFGIFMVLSAIQKAKRSQLRFVFLLLPLCLLSSSAAARVDIRNAPHSSGGPGLQFAIADFDGDLQPDLVRIQGGLNSSGTADYWIQFQLSDVGRRSIRMVAPAGGLRIEARDVDGDNNVDLILATAWFNQPVAVFLNNGHGSFSQVDPASIHEAFNESKTALASVFYQAKEAVGLPSQWGANICLETRVVFCPRLPAGFMSLSGSQFHFSHFFIFSLGRAPPSKVSHL